MNEKRTFDEALGTDRVQRLYRFTNGYGASCVRAKLMSIPGLDMERAFGRAYGSYTRNEHEWEVAVIHWSGENFTLVYDTPITDDVLGYVDESDLDALLDRIEALPPRPA